MTPTYGDLNCNSLLAWTCWCFCGISDKTMIQRGRPMVSHGSLTQEGMVLCFGGILQGGCLANFRHKHAFATSNRSKSQILDAAVAEFSQGCRNSHLGPSNMLKLIRIFILGIRFNLKLLRNCLCVSDLTVGLYAHYCAQLALLFLALAGSGHGNRISPASQGTASSICGAHTHRCCQGSASCHSPSRLQIFSRHVWLLWERFGRQAWEQARGVWEGCAAAATTTT